MQPIRLPTAAKAWLDEFFSGPLSPLVNRLTARLIVAALTGPRPQVATVTSDTSGSRRVWRLDGATDKAHLRWFSFFLASTQPFYHRIVDQSMKSPRARLSWLLRCRSS